MKKLKRFWALLPALILWLMFSMLVWGFVFTRITDTTPARKLVVYIDASVPDYTALSERLEALTEFGSDSGDIRMIQARPFTYALMGAGPGSGADIYIVPENHIEEYSDWFCPLPEAYASGRECYYISDAAYGIAVNASAPKVSVLSEYVQFDAGTRYWLFLSASSLHAGASDDAAFILIETMLGSDT